MNRNLYLWCKGTALSGAVWGLAAWSRADLVRYSPFLPASSASPAAENLSETLELRGIMSTDEGQAYCIYDRAKKTSAWVRLGEPGFDFVILSADSADDSITISVHGRSLGLALRAAKVASAGSASSSRSAANLQTLASSAISDAVHEPTEEEQARLRAAYAQVHQKILERQREHSSEPAAADFPTRSGSDPAVR